MRTTDHNPNRDCFRPALYPFYGGVDHCSQTWHKPGFGLGRNISANGIWILRNAFFGFVPTKNWFLAAPAAARCIAGQVCSCGGGRHFWRILVITGRGQTFGCVDREYDDRDGYAFRLAACNVLATRAYRQTNNDRSLRTIS